MKLSVRHQLRLHPVHSTPTAFHCSTDYISLTSFLWAGEMAQIIWVLAAKPDELSLIPQNPLVEGIHKGFSCMFPCMLSFMTFVPTPAFHQHPSFKAPVVSLGSQGPTEASHPWIFFYSIFLSIHALFLQVATPWEQPGYLDIGFS